MGRVWKTPSLTGIEVLWRWCAGAVLLLLLWFQIGRGLYRAALARNSVTIGFSTAELADVRVWLALLVWIAAWLLAFSAGRMVILRRLGAVHARWRPIALFTLMRVLLLGALVFFWAAVMLRVARGIPWNSTAFTSQINLVGKFAAAVLTTLAVFLVWSLLSWRFWLPLVVSAEEGLCVNGSLRKAWEQRAVSAKMVEINFVMGIVKVALLVLAMTFSACPLPFQNVATQQFLTWWWTGVGVLWVLASDFFHVVRMASYLALYRAAKS
jgi:hypothetical protein